MKKIVIKNIELKKRQILDPYSPFPSTSIEGVDYIDFGIEDDANGNYIPLNEYKIEIHVSKEHTNTNWHEEFSGDFYRDHSISLFPICKGGEYKYSRGIYKEIWDGSILKKYIEYHDVINGKWGYINEDGKPIIPFVYDVVSHFHWGLAVAIKGDDINILDDSGKICKSKSMSEYKDYKVAFILAGNRCFYIVSLYEGSKIRNVQVVTTRRQIIDLHLDDESLELECGFSEDYCYFSKKQPNERKAWFKMYYYHKYNIILGDLVKECFSLQESKKEIVDRLQNIRNRNPKLDVFFNRLVVGPYMKVYIKDKIQIDRIIRNQRYSIDLTNTNISQFFPNWENYMNKQDLTESIRNSGPGIEIIDFVFNEKVIRKHVKYCWLFPIEEDDGSRIIIRYDDRFRFNRFGDLIFEFV